MELYGEEEEPEGELEEGQTWKKKKQKEEEEEGQTWKK